MSIFAWLRGIFKPKPPPPPVPIDQDPGPIGEIVRMGEAAAGDR